MAAVGMRAQGRAPAARIGLAAGASSMRRAEAGREGS